MVSILSALLVYKFANVEKLDNFEIDFKFKYVLETIGPTCAHFQIIMVNCLPLLPYEEVMFKPTDNLIHNFYCI